MLFTGRVGLYAKAAFATLMAVVTAAYTSLDGENFNFSDKDTMTMVIAGLTALGVYFIPNSKNSEV
jgi:hypothetical protein